MNKFQLKNFIKKNNVITKFKGTENSLKESNYELITNNAGAFFSRLPTMIASSQLKDAYYIRIPEGFTINDLTRLISNGELTTILKKGGKIAGQASLYSASLNSVALGVFSVLSVVTSQYFLNTINNKLEQIRKQLSEVKDILNVMNYSELHANIELIQEIHRDCDAIISNPNYVQAVIAKILDIKSNSMSFIRFYSEMMDSKTKTLENYKFWKCTENDVKMVELINYRDCYQLSLSLYFAACIMQVVYTENLHNVDYVDRLVTDFENMKAKYAKVIDSFQTDCNQYIGSQKEKINKEIADRLVNNNNLRFYDDLNETISRIKHFSRIQEEYVVIDNKIYAKLPA